MNRPCAGCGKPVLLLAEAEPPAFSKAWCDECYRAHTRSLADTAAKLVIGTSSHDDRVADGLERP